MFDTLLDPWQLTCTLLIIAVVLIAGRWYGIESGRRDAGESASDTDGEA